MNDSIEEGATGAADAGSGQTTQPQPSAVITTSPKPEKKGRVSAERSKRDRIGQLLKKHNAVIHIEGNLNLIERKIYNVLLLNAMDSMLTERTHHIPVAILCEMMGYDSNNWRHLKAALKNLQSTILEVNLLRNGRHFWEAMTLLSYASIENGICTYRYDEAIAHRLHRPEFYTNINLSVQNQFKTGHALALYENCVRFRDTGSTGAWELDLFRLMLGVQNDRSYDDFKTLNHHCIKSAVREINEVSDITVEPFYQKEGRKVERVGFKVARQKQIALLGSDIDDPANVMRQSSLYIRLCSHGLADAVACMYIKHDAGRAEAAVRYLERCITQPGKRIANHAAYLRALIDCGANLDKTDAGPDTAAKALLEATRVARERAEKDTQSFQKKAQDFRAKMDALTADDLECWRQKFSAQRKHQSPAKNESAETTEKIFQLWMRSQLTGEKSAEARQIMH